MRAVSAILCISWIIGVSEGVFHIPYKGQVFVALLAVSFLIKITYRFQVIAAVVLVLFLGGSLGSMASQKHLPSCDISTPIRGSLVEVRGMYPTHTLSVFNTTADCSILVYAPRRPALIVGAQAILGGKIEDVRIAFRNIPEYALFLEDSGITRVIRNADVRVEAQGFSVVGRMRLYAMNVFDQVFREPDSGIVTAMMIGDRGMIPSSITQAFQKSGITHILSISGFHVSLLVGVLSFALLRLPIPRWAYLGIVLAVLWEYIFVTGAQSAAIRSGMFLTFVIIAYRLHALVGLSTIILLTLAILLSFDPLLIRSVGFELSVASVTGIGMGIVFFRRMHISKSLRPFLLSVIVSSGATFATLPLTAYYFGNISLIGIFVNIIVVPLVAVLMYVALVALLLYLFFEPLGIGISFIVHILTKALVSIAYWGASVPYGSFQHIVFPIWAVGMYYGCFFIGIVLMMRLFHIRFRELWV